MVYHTPQNSIQGPLRCSLAPAWKIFPHSSRRFLHVNWEWLVLLKISHREAPECLSPYDHIKPCRQSSSQNFLFSLQPPVTTLIAFPWVVFDPHWLLCPRTFLRPLMAPIFLYHSKKTFYSSFYLLSCTLHPALNTIFEDIKGLSLWRELILCSTNHRLPTTRILERRRCYYQKRKLKITLCISIKLSLQIKKQKQKIMSEAGERSHD